MNKEEFLKLVKSMPDGTKFDLKLKWIENEDKMTQYASFDTNYEMGSIVYHRFG